ncbi:MAG: lysoplasmalogenase [Erythrobacter sp.]
MPKRALIEHRPWLLAGLVCALAYYFLWNNPIGELWLIALKGASIGALAVYAWQRGSGADAVLLTLSLVVTALAAMTVDLYFQIGWLLFALAWLIASGLFLRNLMPRSSINRRVVALVLLVGTPLAAWFLTGAASATIYACAPALMAATGWSSRFARRHVGAGVVALVLSDLLTFSEGSAFDTGDLPDFLAWPLFYAGLLMVATGVVQSLRAEDD